MGSLLPRCLGASKACAELVEGTLPDAQTQLRRRDTRQDLETRFNIVGAIIGKYSTISKQLIYFSFIRITGASGARRFKTCCGVEKITRAPAPASDPWRR